MTLVAFKESLEKQLAYYEEQREKAARNQVLLEHQLRQALAQAGYTQGKVDAITELRAQINQIAELARPDPNDHDSHGARFPVEKFAKHTENGPLPNPLPSG